MWAKSLACSMISSHPLLPPYGLSYCAAWCEILVPWFALCPFRSLVANRQSNDQWWTRPGKNKNHFGMILKHFSEVFLLVFVFLFFGFCLVFFVGKHYIKPSRIFKILFLGIKSYLKHHCWAIFSIYGQKASFLLPLLHFLFSFILRTSQGFAFPAPPSTGPSLLHGILLSRLSWPAFWPGLSHGWDMVGLELPPHPLGTASLGLCGRSHFLPATRRFDVLISVCCLQLEAKHLSEAHPSELSRRTFSVPALGDLILSHNFPPTAGLLPSPSHSLT